MDIWKIIADIASVVIILGFVITLIQWWRTPAHKLEAAVEWNSFRMPPQVTAEFAEQAAKVKRTIEEFQNTNPEQEGNDPAYRRADRLGWNISINLKDDVSYQLSSLRGCWVAAVKNTGKKKCVDVNLNLPKATKATLKHDRDEKPTGMDVSGVIHIGELRPRGECEVIAWTEWSLSNFDYASVNLSHESGVGRVHGMWRNGRFSYVAGYVLKLVAVFLAVLALSFALIVAKGWLISHSQQQSSSANPAAPRAETTPSSKTP